jgi:general secretion pathway protein D
MKTISKKIFFSLIFLFTLMASEKQDANKKNSNDTQEDQKAIVRKISKNLPMKKGSDFEPKAVELNFENASLKTFLDYIQDLLKVTFIIQEEKTADPSRPSPGQPQPKNLSEIKINYRSFSGISTKQIWALVDLFLETAGFARVSQKNIGKNIYRIIPIPQSNRAPISSYIGTNIESLPNTGRIRYVYFAQNTSITDLKNLANQIKSSSSGPIEVFDNLKAMVLTDSAYNIKSLLKIIQEIDAGSTPEVLSILKLENAEAADVAKLYETLRGKDEPFKRAFEPKKQGSFYFPQDAKVIPEPRTNSLILLGSKDAISRIEDFITKNLDSKLKKLPSPIHVYELNYAPAEQVADILNKVSQFGSDTEAAKYGGVRGGQKYFTKLTVTPDKQGNRLLIRCSEEDFKLLKPTIDELDQKQPQVVIEVLIVDIRLDKTKAMYSALRNKNDSRVNFQTSGFFGQGIQVQNTEATNYSGSLITNLINLATSAIAGSTVLSLGKESVWALVSSLEQFTELNIISNPFIVATNKYKSLVSLGTTRRVISGTVFGGSETNQSERTSLSAKLQVQITPQINSFGIINLDIEVLIEEFTAPFSDPDASGNKSEKVIKTNANVADGEVLALGGLIRNKADNSQSEVPLLGRIPIIGYLFKNKQDTATNSNLLIFMSPKIIKGENSKISSYTNTKANYARGMLCEAENQEVEQDPIYQLWFKNKYDNPMDQLNQMVPPQTSPAQTPVLIQPMQAKHYSLIKPSMEATND